MDNCGLKIHCPPKHLWKKRAEVSGMILLRGTHNDWSLVTGEQAKNNMCVVFSACRSSHEHETWPKLNWVPQGFARETYVLPVIFSWNFWIFERHFCYTILYSSGSQPVFTRPTFPELHYPFCNLHIFLFSDISTTSLSEKYFEIENKRSITLMFVVSLNPLIDYCIV